MFCALGVAHLLEENLLGGLRGDASHLLHRHRNLQLVADLDLVAGHLAAPRRATARGAGFSTSSTTTFDGEDFEARLRRPLDLNLLARLELLARGGAHGLLHRLDDDLAVDAVLFAEGVNALRMDALMCFSCQRSAISSQQERSALDPASLSDPHFQFSADLSACAALSSRSRCSARRNSSSTSISRFALTTAASGDADAPRRLVVKDNLVALDADDATAEVALAVDGLARLHLRQPPAKRS